MKTKHISIPIPAYPSILEKFSISTVKASVYSLFLEKYNAAGQPFQSTRSKSRMHFRAPNFFHKIPKFQFDKKSLLRVSLPVLGIVLLAAVVWTAFSDRESTQAIQGMNNEAPIPLASQNLNKGYSFPVREGDDELTNFSYEILDAHLQKQIIVKGQRATAVDGRIFLVLDIKLSNDFDQALSINTRDYVRVVLDGNTEELLAPDIHNDPVEVQAISTKPTRLGLSIDENTSSIQLQVGEIDGEKESISLDLSY